MRNWNVERETLDKEELLYEDTGMLQFLSHTFRFTPEPQSAE